MLVLPIRMVLLIMAFVVIQGCQEKGAKSGKGKDTLTYNLHSEPTTIHPFNATDGYSRALFSYACDRLMIRDIDTNDWKPALAESWEISKDKKTFTFKLREGLVWHDGKPVTPEDVKFSFDGIFSPDFNAAHMRPYYENVNSPEILDARTVRFTVKDDYFGNFDQIGDLFIVPKHYYGDQALKKEHNKKLICSGAYKIAKYEKGKRFVLEQNSDWWGRKDPEFSKYWQFKRFVLRFIKEENVEMESFKKGDLDFIGMSPAAYMTKTTGPEWGKKIHKVKTSNKTPKGYSYVAWNLKNPIFADKNVRKALAMLYNRQLAMDKFELGVSAHADGPIPVSSEYHSPNLKPVTFDPPQALKILRENGWKDTDGDGILDKVLKGRKTQLSFTILAPSEDYTKYVTIYREEAKKMGVEINIKNIEWNSLVKLIDERKFDGIQMAWGGGDVDIDLKQIWHTSSINGGSNFISYSNPEVDKLIDLSRRTFEKEKRIPILQKASEIIASEDPYLFMFTPVSVMYGYNDRINRPKDTFNYSVGLSRWTIQQD